MQRQNTSLIWRLEDGGKVTAEKDEKAPCYTWYYDGAKAHKILFLFIRLEAQEKRRDLQEQDIGRIAMLQKFYPTEVRAS